MRIGLLADIHEQVEHLEAAIELLVAEGVDRILTLGDIFETGERVEETIQVLQHANVRGIWGNHDLGLCHHPDREFTAKFGATVMDFFATLDSHLELDDVHLCHSMPTWNVTDPTIYYVGEPPWNPEALADEFASSNHRIYLAGHFHRWFAATERGQLDWKGSAPLQFDRRERYFVIVHGVFDGWCGILDTAQNVLTPYSVRQR